MQKASHTVKSNQGHVCNQGTFINLIDSQIFHAMRCACVQKCQNKKIFIVFFCLKVFSHWEQGNTNMGMISKRSLSSVMSEKNMNHLEKKKTWECSPGKFGLGVRRTFTNICCEIFTKLSGKYFKAIILGLVQNFKVKLSKS